MKYTIQAKSPVHAAVKAFETPGEFCEALGISRQSLSRWRKRGWFPEGRIARVHELTGIPAEQLRRRP